MNERHRFDTDPDALNWARDKISHELDKWREWRRQADDRGDVETRTMCDAVAARLTDSLIGGGGCVVAAFDARLPALIPLLDAADREAATGEVTSGPEMCACGHWWHPGKCAVAACGCRVARPPC